jgi:hypothetical protein
MSTYMREVDEIVAGTSEQAQLHLMTLLSELFNTLLNLDVLCSLPHMPCQQYMKFEKLNRLLIALVEAQQKQLV